MGRVVDWAQLKSELDRVRGARKIVFTNGCFDLLHVGHVRYLKDAKSRGDLLVVGLNADASVRRLKGETRPIQSESDRAEIMASLACVDFVTIFAEDVPEPLIRLVKPDVLVKGGDWKVEQINGGTFVQSYGGQVLSLSFVDGRSTTKIVEKMNSKA